MHIATYIEYFTLKILWCSPTYSTSFGAFPNFVSEAGDTFRWDSSTVAQAFCRKCTASIDCRQQDILCFCSASSLSAM